MALESSSGKGLDTPKATQLAKMASRMKMSKGLEAGGQGLVVFGAGGEGIRLQH